MEHADTINNLMPCDASGDFLAVWVDDGGTEHAVLSQKADAGRTFTCHGYISNDESPSIIAALEAMDEQDRPHYLVSVAS